jgi:hypothetical protein
MVIVLHFSGYGYGRRGLCSWLVRDLAQVLQSRSGVALSTFFHEIYADSPPWRSAFWVKRQQQRIALDLMALSRVVRTNGERQRRWLAGHAPPSLKVGMAPSFSNVGELAGRGEPPSTRPNKAVVFGTVAGRRRALAHQRLGAGLRALGIDRLIEIGPGESVAEGLFPVDFLGRLPALELSDVLAQSCYGIVNHPPWQMEKSTILAAYAAHGCVPLITSATQEPSYLLTAGTHYLHLGDARPNNTILDQIGSALYDWYQPHCLQAQALEFMSELVAL